MKHSAFVPSPQVDQHLPNDQLAQHSISTSNYRTGMTVADLKQAFLDNLFYDQGKFPGLATQHDYYMALAFTVRDRLLQHWNHTAATYTERGSRTVAYFSAEFLMGPQLGKNLISLGIFDQVKEAITDLGLDFEMLLDEEPEPGLGNGGLGRLAACYLDSLATLEIPTLGYGIRYEFGIFQQDFQEGWQVEKTDKWLRLGNPWEIKRPEWEVEVKFGGHTVTYRDGNSRYRVRWVPDQIVMGVPYDTPILGYQTSTANTLRLWTAEAPESFNFASFNSGDYLGAVYAKVISENISKVLYPNDDSSQGKQLRLTQQYFFVACSLRDMFRILLGQGIPLEQFHEKFAVQLNDTHPSIAVAELMRLLVDTYHMDWDQAWSITQRTFAYTNHTLLPEALEQWPVELFGRLLPRHLELIYEINHRFLDEVRIKFPGDEARLVRLSLINDRGERSIRMAHLACLGSHTVNGVAALHTELLKQDVLTDFYAMYPHKFQNKTNGVTPRRFMVLSNAKLTQLITEKIGDQWIKSLDQLQQLEAYADDAEFQEAWREIKLGCKRDLASFIQQQTGLIVDPQSMFDVLVKRFHEYKRQHLKLLHIITLYNRIKANPDIEMIPRTFIFGGKAAPGYWMAKLIIKLINSVADVVNRDPDVRGRLKVVFLKNFNVKLAQQLYPAADLSEQISTAGKEASGTGNMKFSLNGALTIGTLDGANVEIRKQVGADNFFLFGLTTEQVYDLRGNGYCPRHYYESNPELKLVIDRIASGFFSRGDTAVFKPLIDSLVNDDPYFLLADFQSYVDCQSQVDLTFSDRTAWTKMSILNVARSGFFSSDRAIQEYCDDIWRIEPVNVDLPSSDRDSPASKLDGSPVAPS